MTGMHCSNSHSSNCGSSCAVATSHTHLGHIMDTVCIAVSILLVGLLCLRILC